MLRSEEIRQVVGFLLMTIACLTTLCVGDRPVRSAALLIAAAWLGVFLAQRLTGLTVEPVMVGEVAAGFGLLFLATTYSNVWLSILVGFESALLFLQAIVYDYGEKPSALNIIGNNILTTAILIVLVVAAIRSRRRSTADGLGAAVVNIK